MSFSIATINATLYNGDNALSVGRTVREDRLSLGRFELTSIGVKLDMKSDTSMVAHVWLKSMSLDDTRPGRETAINRYNRLQAWESFMYPEFHEVALN